MRDVRLSDDVIDPTLELACFQSRIGDEAGACVTFTGTCRATTSSGEPLTALILETYKGVTLASMEQIAAAAQQRFVVSDLAIVHRAGRIHPGEAIVFVATAARHRRAAFAAVDYLMDRLKCDAVFWKKEETAGGSNWIEPTAGDHADKARWGERQGHD